MASRKPLALLALLTGALLWVNAATRADEKVPADSPKVAQTAPQVQGNLDPNAAKDVPADIEQQALKNRFERFQKTVMQMAEQMQKNEPDRADLLFRTLSKSQEERVVAQMKAIEELLAKPESELGESISRQESLIKSLYLLLELLQSENRLSEIDAERARITDILKDVNRLIGGEKDARAATEVTRTAPPTSKKTSKATPRNSPTRSTVKTPPNAKKMKTRKANQAKASRAMVSQVKENRPKENRAKVSQARANQVKASLATTCRRNPSRATKSRQMPSQPMPSPVKVNQAKANRAKANRAKASRAKVSQAKVSQAKASQAKVSRAKVSRAKASRAKANKTRSSRIRPLAARNLRKLVTKWNGRSIGSARNEIAIRPHATKTKRSAS